MASKRMFGRFVIGSTILSGEEQRSFPRETRVWHGDIEWRATLRRSYLDIF